MLILLVLLSSIWLISGRRLAGMVASILLILPIVFGFYGILAALKAMGTRMGVLDVVC